MINIITELLASLQATCRDMLPIAVIIIGFQVLVIRKPISHPKKIVSGLVCVILGVSFFLQGLELALFPLGKLMARQLTSSLFLGVTAPGQLTDWKTYGWVYVFAASIGFATTFAEPSLLAVALKAEKISGGAVGAFGLRFAVSIGVAFGIALGAFRIVTGTELYYFIIIGYIVVIIQTAFAPRQIIGLAYDSGGVTTSTVTVPLVTALGLGLAQAVPGRNILLDGFGLIAFASLFPIIAVLGYAQIAHWFNNRNQSS